MIVVGGATRLTDSGLSMVEWKPITGVIPPLNQADWQKEFKKYTTSPEYNKINQGINLSEFKYIYLWEFGHRLLGRVTGLIFIFPLIYFWYKGCFSRYHKSKLLVTLLLGCLQGFFGWYMVKSGLVDNPHVSQYRLALHLSTAIIVVLMIEWLFLKICFADKKFHRFLNRNLLFLFIWIFLQIISGAFVAGLDAGLVYNSFPLMEGRLIPNGLWQISPFYLNFFENITMVQFLHRISAISLFFYNVYLLYRFKNNSILKLLKPMLLLLILQIIIGIITLLNQVPLFWGLVHQINAVLIIMFSLFILFYSTINNKKYKKKYIRNKK
jgi:cytochrome c oxidase assembly protein subunit 15